ncbi:MAG: TMEM165/GDT1 family protein [Elusimicrobiota bacterium]
MEDIFVPFLTIALAELGDKTQLALLLLSSKTKKHIELLAGTIIAFMVVDGVAVLSGLFINNIIPERTLKAISGVIFVIFGVFILKELKRKEDADGKGRVMSFKSPLLTGFTFIFLAEWGDKTQVASMLFATRYNPLMVLAGVVLSLTLLSAAAIYAGSFVSRKINKTLMTKIAGAGFIIIGMSFLIF